jgi:hypothetical protein
VAEGNVADEVRGGEAVGQRPPEIEDRGLVGVFEGHERVMAVR